ncbi:MAG: hypothetical protein LBR00_00770 [Clostridiales Family XIII bacterium]|jgi:hypothetical protein|nr:hypothetical protein [Clostridiales Family XIII bacterium]
MNKSDLKVIRGGALGRPLPEQKFIDAYVTNTRLMGVLVIYIRWKISGALAERKQSRSLHQFFYVETTEEGIESYRGIYGEDVEELREAEQMMLGGLGADKVMLTMNEATWLVQEFAKLNKKLGLPLPDEVSDYSFVLERETSIDKAREDRLFRMICGKITNDNQLINYFLMRYYARDFYPVRMLAAQGTAIPEDLAGDLEWATLCLNEIREEKNDDGERVWLCESVVEEDRGHRILVSELALTGPKGPERRVERFSVLSSFSISPAEAAMKLARPEFVTVYEIAGPVDNVLDELDERYLGALQNLTEGGKLYVRFMDDNRHVGLPVYRLNDDVREILYVTVEDQLIVGAYTLSGIRLLENKLMLSPIARQLIEVAKYEFKEQILYDYTLSYGGDFVHYVDEVMGFEPDDEE